MNSNFTIFTKPLSFRCISESYTVEMKPLILAFIIITSNHLSIFFLFTQTVIHYKINHTIIIIIKNALASALLG